MKHIIIALIFTFLMHQEAESATCPVSKVVYTKTVQYNGYATTSNQYAYPWLPGQVYTVWMVWVSKDAWGKYVPPEQSVGSWRLKPPNSSAIYSISYRFLKLSKLPVNDCTLRNVVKSWQTPRIYGWVHSQ